MQVRQVIAAADAERQQVRKVRASQGRMPDKDNVAARHVLGRLLEPIGNDGSRKMITQRHNPAYRFACNLNEYKNTV